MCEVGRVFPRHVQRTCLTGESPLGCPRVAYTLRLYNYLLRFYLTALPLGKFSLSFLECSYKGIRRVPD